MRSAILALTALLLFASPAGVRAAERSASPSNLASVFSAAQPGDTILLASGSYSFTGGSKTSTVTLKPASGATVSMRASFRSGGNIRLDGLTIDDLDITGTAHDITVANSQFTGMTVISSQQMSNANILLDHNTHANINVCSDCYEGRVSLPGSGPNPSGVTIQNSLFEGGNTDGIQNGANGVRILNNEFRNIRQANGVHTDAIQLYGQRNTTISGNYIHDNSSAIMAPDGGTNESITNNVFVGDGGPQIQMGSHAGTTFIHNTVKNADVHMDSKDGESASRDGILRDNVMVNASFGTTGGSGCSGCTVSYNLFAAQGDASGANSLIGTPVFAGGSAPTSYAAFALKAGSPGKANASDGTDRGINLGATGGGPVVPPSPPPTPGGGGGGGGGGTGGGGGGGTGGGTGTGGSTGGSASGATPALAGTAASERAASESHPTRAVGVRWTFRPSKPKVGTRIVLVAPHTKAGGRTCRWTIAKGITRRGCVIAVRYRKAGLKRISVRIDDRSGTTVRGTGYIRVVAASLTRRS